MTGVRDQGPAQFLRSQHAETGNFAALQEYVHWRIFNCRTAVSPERSVLISLLPTPFAHTV
jgi:hypothetical protein